MSEIKINTKKLIGALAITTVAALGAVVALTKELTKVAIKRDIPSVPDGVGKILVGKENPSFDHEKIEQNKAHMLETSHEDVEITSYDGLKLKGSVYKCENEKRTLIFFHGWRSNRYIDFGEAFDFYKSTESNLIFVDQRGQNGSEGDFVGFGVYERFDVLEWIKFATERFDVPIFLLGISMGATTVLMSSGFVLNAKVHGIIADCGFTSPHEIWSHIIKDNLKLDEHLVYGIANRELKAKAKYDGDAYSTLDAMETNTTPILFIHGTSDTFVPVKMTYKNYGKCKAPKELLIVPGAAHGYSYIVETEKYKKTVLDFLEKHN